MEKCPNCGQALTGREQTCPNCGFNVEKYRRDYFPDRQEEPERAEKAETVEKAGETAAEKEPADKLSRSAYRHKQEQPALANPTVEKMIQWLRDNTTIAFLTGVGLLIVMSFSRPLGWTAFAICMLLLIWTGHRGSGGEYTADRNLTEKIRAWASKIFNAFDDKENELEEKNEDFTQAHPKFEAKVEKVKKQAKARKPRNFGIIQLSILLTSLITLVLLFLGTGFVTSSSKLTVASVFFEVANRQITSGKIIPALILYLFLAVFLLLPVFIMLAVSQNTRVSRVRAFLLSLVESLTLIYLFYRLGQTTSADSYMGQAVTSLKSYAVAIGISGYLLILVSCMTTVLSGINAFQPMAKPDQKEEE
ncbi:zinc ribbon domain-containing protein [Lactobacillus nasalidis]|uniref:Zinc ribbon domain-containing protein n=1 Tax=Lactobacillus nasalidis TaxID=2797258 RepID=A0ABQ3W415_9LACO|nr:zinc ribbon domain-containing protein [Lactobacillus nasalidis]GHV98297.1 zinc ribbon domain-containing protein [Lactobacillus nasalidis]GHV99269.1 zinc ribbon domain-containing protein [Lactobacillus nasalidis]GHW01218.1 zinc ribbon domain-containing protein [Lactobacillus nasalidis]